MIRLTPAMRQEIEDTIEAEHACGSSVLAEALTMLMKMHDQGAALAAAGPAQDEWRDIERDPPPKGEDVMVWWPTVALNDDGEIEQPLRITGGARLISCLDGLVWQEPDCMNAIGEWFGDDSEYAEAPTHWRPLPAPPVQP